MRGTRARTVIVGAVVALTASLLAPIFNAAGATVRDVKRAPAGGMWLLDAGGGVHALADPGMASTLPAVVVVLVLGVIGLLGLEPGTSVLLIGLALALSLADHVRRTNRAAFSP